MTSQRSWFFSGTQLKKTISISRWSWIVSICSPWDSCCWLDWLWALRTRTIRSASLRSKTPTGTPRCAGCSTSAYTGSSGPSPVPGDCTSTRVRCLQWVVYWAPNGLRILAYNIWLAKNNYIYICKNLKLLERDFEIVYAWWYYAEPLMGWRWEQIRYDGLNTKKKPLETKRKEFCNCLNSGWHAEPLMGSIW